MSIALVCVQYHVRMCCIQQYVQQHDMSASTASTAQHLWSARDQSKGKKGGHNNSPKEQESRDVFMRKVLALAAAQTQACRRRFEPRVIQLH